MCIASQYKMEFTAEQWEEIEGMGFEGFEPMPDKALSRVQWIAIAHMAAGQGAADRRRQLRWRRGRRRRGLGRRIAGDSLQDLGQVQGWRWPDVTRFSRHGWGERVGL